MNSSIDRLFRVQSTVVKSTVHDHTTLTGRHVSASVAKLKDVQEVSTSIQADVNVNAAISNAHEARFLIRTHASANVRVKFCAYHRESLTKTHAGVSATTTECVSPHSNTATDTASAFVQDSSIALEGRCSATRHVTVCAVTGRTVLHPKYSTRKAARVNVQQSSSAELRLYSARTPVIVNVIQRIANALIQLNSLITKPASVLVHEF